MRTRTLAAIAGAVASTAMLSPFALAEPTPVVYEGRLSYLDVPVESRADLRFRLFDAAAGGNQIGDTIERPATALRDGAFRVSLDLDTASGAWLEVSVRAPAGEGDYVVLSPRQRIESPGGAPLVHDSAGSNAADAGADGSRASLSLSPRDPGGPTGASINPDPSAGAPGSLGRPDDQILFGPTADWVPNGSDIFYNAGNVGIGITAPGSPLTVQGDAATLVNARNTRNSGTAIAGVAAGGAVSKGVFGLSVSGGGIGVQGQASNTSGVCVGVDGLTASSSGRAVRGRATSATGFAFGLHGQADSNQGRGVFGYAPSATGGTIGVIGWAKSPDGYGVQGLNDNSMGTALYGNASSATGVNFAVRGMTASPSGWGGYFEGGRGVFIEATDILADSGDLFSTGGVIAVEATKARLELLSDPNGTEGSLVALKEVDVSGSFTDSWNVYRTTQGSSSELRFAYSALAGNVGTTRFTILNSGDVGIGRTPAANELEVEGNASKDAAGDWLANSDRRIKTNVETVTDALDTLDRVRLVSFEYTDEYMAEHPKLADRRYLNVIAQEFAEVFPEHVQGSGEFLPDGSEILQVDTYPLTIYSAAAVQELRGVVRSQDARITELESRIESLSERRGLSRSSMLWPLALLAGVGALAAARRKKESNA